MEQLLKITSEISQLLYQTITIILILIGLWFFIKKKTWVRIQVFFESYLHKHDDFHFYLIQQLDDDKGLIEYIIRRENFIDASYQKESFIVRYECESKILVLTDVHYIENIREFFSDNKKLTSKEIIKNQ